MVVNDMSAAETVQAMFGMGTWETMIILVVALIFLGPDKLPAVAKSIGKGMRTLRRAMSSVEYEVQAMTNPDRYAPPKRTTAEAKQRGAAQAATNAAEGEPEQHDESDTAHGPDGAYDYDYHRQDGDASTAADSGAANGGEVHDHLAPPDDYDHHRAPADADAAATVDAANVEDGPVAAAHPYRPARRPAVARPGAAEPASTASAAAELIREQEDVESA